MVSDFTAALSSLKSMLGEKGSGLRFCDSQSSNGYIALGPLTSRALVEEITTSRRRLIQARPSKPRRRAHRSNLSDQNARPGSRTFDPRPQSTHPSLKTVHLPLQSLGPELQSLDRELQTFDLGRENRNLDPKRHFRLPSELIFTVKNPEIQPEIDASGGFASNVLRLVP
jgi:hypothetical protein